MSSMGYKMILKNKKKNKSQNKRKTGGNNGLLINRFLMNNSRTAIQQEKDVSEKK